MKMVVYFAIAASLLAAFFSPTGARAQVIPISCPPVCAPPSPGPASTGPSISGGGGLSVGLGIAVGAYIMRGMVGAQVIAHTEHRQATLCEFLTWPMPRCGRLSRRERRYLELALTYENLRSVQERLIFARAGGQAFSWPSTGGEMRRAIRFERRSFRFNRN